MTKRQWENLGMGLVFMVVGISFFVYLKSAEGSVVYENGKELVYTVDPNVFLIMFLISLVGVLIVLLTVAEYRWQSRAGEAEVNIMELIRKKEDIPPPKPKEPKQKKKLALFGNKEQKTSEEQTPEDPPARPDPIKTTPPLAAKKPAPARPMQTRPVQNPEPVKVTGQGPSTAAEPAPAKTKTPDSPQSEAWEPVKIVPEPVAAIKETVKAEPPEPMASKEPEEVGFSAPEPAATVPPEPLSVDQTGPVNDPEPVKVKLAPVKVEAIGLCPMCGKVILLDQEECVKCGWKVIVKNLVPFD